MKIFKVIRKVVKWYLIANALLWAFVGTKELWREDLDDMGVLGKDMILLEEAFHTWKCRRYVTSNKEEES